MENKPKQLYFDFDEYIRQGEPEQAENAAQWQTAMGLQAVDGLKPSQYLIDVAKKNIEGDISIDEVQELLRSYYANSATRQKVEEDDEEADKAAVNIKRILSTRTLAFNTNGYISVHRRIFEGVFKHAGQLRKYDITKKEWVLKGDTVNYLNWEDLRRAIDYDIQQEKEFSYKGLSEAEKISHLCRFTAGLWQIHAFCEGNTRTTAVFLIQYLRSIGYKVNNDLFAHHSWYFRNALVRANYKNHDLGINYEYKYLELFFRNLLMGEHHELKNRYLIIDAPDNWNVGTSTMLSTGTQESTQETGKSTQETKEINVAVNVAVEITERQNNILSIIKNGVAVKENDVAVYVAVNTKLLADRLGVNRKTIQRDLNVLLSKNLIVWIGSDKTGHWEIISGKEEEV